MKNSFIILTFAVLISLFSFGSCKKDIAPDISKTISTKPTAQKISSRDDSPSLFADNHVVPAYIAKTLAEKINKTVSDKMKIGTSTAIRKVDSLFTISNEQAIPVMYIGNYSNGGYIVISADDRHEPILALVERGKYEVTEAPSMLLEWFDITFDNIMSIKSGAISNTQLEFANAEWLKVLKDIGNEEYMVTKCCAACPNYPECLSVPSIGCGEPDINCQVGGDPNPCGPLTTTTRGPLITTRWGQGCSYNELCPDKDCDNVCTSNENAWTGCVATGMAQILRYWEHPCSQSYDYGTMPNNSGNDEVQRMMRDVGESVDMNYDCDGSGASGGKTDDAFKDDFCFTSADRDSYSAGSYQVVIQDIDANRPVLLDGCRIRKNWGLFYTPSKCHMWVCDGYEEHKNKCYNTLKFHMNWGWGSLVGNGNGWFSYNNWNSANGTYQYFQDFTHNIHP